MWRFCSKILETLHWLIYGQRTSLIRISLLFKLVIVRGYLFLRGFFDRFLWWFLLWFLFCCFAFLFIFLWRNLLLFCTIHRRLLLNRDFIELNHCRNIPLTLVNETLQFLPVDIFSILKLFKQIVIFNKLICDEIVGCLDQLLQAERREIVLIH